MTIEVVTTRSINITKEVIKKVLKDYLIENNVEIGPDISFSVLTSNLESASNVTPVLKVTWTEIDFN